jgi:propanol-preferring alcohol dehydrogenase
MLMRAVQVVRPGPVAGQPLEPAEVPRPRPGPGQVLVRVLTCGVCHTDLHVAEGDLQPPRLPVIPGHQAVGVVEEVGPGVDRPAVGARVGVPWLHRTCGSCEFCLEDRENLCLQPLYTGFSVPGGYAEYVLAEAAFVLPLPEVFSDLEAAPLLCAGIIGYRALKLSRVGPGQRLGLAGFGASAHLCLQIALHQGMEVYVFSRSPEHRRLALDLGAAWAGPLEEPPPRPLHGAISFAPTGRLIPFLMGYLRRGGTLALNAVHLDQVPALDYDRQLYWEKSLCSVSANTRQDAHEFLRLAAQVPVRCQVQTYPLEQALQALRDLAQGRVQGAAVLQVAPRPL